jgi:hypothetical protein
LIFLSVGSYPGANDPPSFLQRLYDTAEAVAP